jgi:hypothetical protein
MTSSLDSLEESERERTEELKLIKISNEEKSGCGRKSNRSICVTQNSMKKMYNLIFID